MLQVNKLERRIRLVSVGVLAGSVGYVFYPVVLARVGAVSQGSIQALEPYAITSLALMLSGLVGVSIGIWGAMRAMSFGTRAWGLFPSSPLQTLSYAASERTYGRITVVATIAYGLVYAVISGMVVYQPSLNFSKIYHTGIPSATLVLCCGPLGQVPGALVLASDHVGLLITPANLVLLFLVSWLVGLNFTVALFAHRNWNGHEEQGWLTSMGAFLGLFTACPTCAGFLFSTLIGTAGAVSFALLLASLQPVFIALSIPLLAATLFLSSRRLSRQIGNACALR